MRALDVSAVRGRRIANSNVLFDYWELTKPEINFLIAITAAAGFWIGSPASPPHFPWMPFVHTLLGTVFVASGAGTLNQLIELRYDAQMRRTARRPLASGRIAPSHALWFGVLLSVFGVDVPRHFDECSCIAPGHTHPSQLLVLIHTAKTDYTPVHFGRRDPWRCTTVNRLGSSARASRPNGLGAVRDCFPLAVPTFHVHRVDVSRRLRACRLPRLARGKAQRPLCYMAVPTARPRPFRSGHRSRTSRSGRTRLLCRGSRSWRRLSLLQRTFCPSTLCYGRTACCFLPPSFISRCCLLCSYWTRNECEKERT